MADFEKTKSEKSYTIVETLQGLIRDEEIYLGGDSDYYHGNCIGSHRWRMYANTIK